MPHGATPNDNQFDFGIEEKSVHRAAQGWLSIDNDATDAIRKLWHRLENLPIGDDTV